VGLGIGHLGNYLEEKSVWQTLGEGNEDCVEWVVLCAALNLLDDEILKAAEKQQPLLPIVANQGPKGSVPSPPNQARPPPSQQPIRSQSTPQPQAGVPRPQPPPQGNYPGGQSPIPHPGPRGPPPGANGYQRPPQPQTYQGQPLPAQGGQSITRIYSASPRPAGGHPQQAQQSPNYPRHI